MKLVFEVTVEIELESGKNVSREVIVEAIQEALEGADPGSLTVGDSDSEYNTTTWEATERSETNR